MDALPDPEWLDSSFLSHVLYSVEESKHKVEVVKWSCSAAVPPGSNYLSQLYRVFVDYRLEHEHKVHSINIIVKAPLAPGVARNMLDSKKTYEKEVKIYKEVLCVMNELHSCQLTPRSFDCPLENVLVLEDLKFQGFKMADRLKQLDADHCRQSLMILARFHALSVAINHRHPDLIQNICPLITDEEHKYNNMKLFKSCLNNLCSTVTHLDDCKHYAERLRCKIDNSFETILKILEPSDGLNVLNHGDTWTTNILFRYNDSGKVSDVRLVDFQLTRFCSFAYDVIFFWLTSANEDVREHYKDEMFEVYRQTLNQTLEHLECSERLSKKEFDCQMKKYAPFSLSVIVGLLAIGLADPDMGPLDINEMSSYDNKKETNADSAHVKHFQSKYFKAVLPKMLRQVEEFGAFD